MAEIVVFTLGLLVAIFATMIYCVYRALANADYPHDHDYEQWRFEP